jgi:hypothetical protein
MAMHLQCLLIIDRIVEESQVSYHPYVLQDFSRTSNHESPPKISQITAI